MPTISQYLQQIQIQRSDAFKQKAAGFLPYIDTMIAKNKMAEKEKEETDLTNKDILTQALSLGYSPDEAQGWLDRNQGVSNAARPAMFQQHDKARILKGDLERFGAKVDPNAKYSDLVNVHDYYSKAQEAGNEVLTAFKANVETGMPIERALAEAKDAGKYRSSVAEKFGPKYLTIYDEEAKTTTPALAWNKAATAFEAAQPKKGSGGGQPELPKQYKFKKKNTVYNEPGSTKFFVFGTGSDGNKYRWEVEEDENGVVYYLGTDTPVPLEKLHDIATVKSNDFTSYKAARIPKQQKGGGKPAPQKPATPAPPKTNKPKSGKDWSSYQVTE